MSHLREIANIIGAFAGPVLDRAWLWGLGRLQSSADREAARFVHYHPDATIRKARR